MEKTPPQPLRSPSTVPLARDSDGNPIELPDGALGWRIRRQTGGRPRLLLDGKKAPMLFPLDYTIADVEDILSPGNYLLDVVNKEGEPLGVTIGLSLGMPRNAESIEPDNENDAPAAVPTTLPNTMSDVRLVLEANVRATQMAFVHNQRTLEIGLRMAETLRDGVQVLASSQADWIKSLSSARGFFRNAGQVPPLEVKQLTVHTAGEHDGDEDATDESADLSYTAEAASAPHWSKAFEPIMNMVVQQVGPAVIAWFAKQQAAKAAKEQGAGNETRNETSNGDRSPPWELRDLVDWGYAYRKGAAHREKKAAEKQAATEEAGEQAAQQAAAAEHAEQLRAAIAAAAVPGPEVNIAVLMQMLPQSTATRLMQLQAALSPDERSDAIPMLQALRADAVAELLAVFDAASLEQSTELVRKLVGEWRSMLAAKQAAATAPPLSGNGSAGASATGGNESTEPR